MFSEMGELDFPGMEKHVLAFWEEEQVFDRLREKNRGGGRYSFFDGPITANNPRGIGVHHAWGRTYKDVFQRHRAMKGCELRFQNGFDCQGLWVEVEVEKALGLDTKRGIREFGLERFARQCRERIAVTFSAPEPVRQAVERHAEYVRAETLCAEMRAADGAGGEAFSIGGKEVSVVLRRVG